MSVTDPIADLLTRIRNANQMRYNEVVIPSSNMKLEIIKILEREGFIASYKVEKNEVQDNIIVTLKYGKNKERGHHRFRKQPFQGQLCLHLQAERRR